MKTATLLSLFLLCGCSTYQSCRVNAYAQNSHPYVGLGTIIADAFDPPPPHPPLREMLADCDRLK